MPFIAFMFWIRLAVPNILFIHFLPFVLWILFADSNISFTLPIHIFHSLHVLNPSHRFKHIIFCISFLHSTLNFPRALLPTSPARPPATQFYRYTCDNYHGLTNVICFLRTGQVRNSHTNSVPSGNHRLMSALVGLSSCYIFTILPRQYRCLPFSTYPPKETSSFFF